MPETRGPDNQPRQSESGRSIAADDEPPKAPNGHKGFDFEKWKAGLLAAVAAKGIEPPEPEPASGPHDFDRVTPPGEHPDDPKHVPKKVGFLVRADTVKARNIDWVWRHRLANGEMHLIAGAAGTGKSTIAFDWAATISSGGKFPDGTVAPVGKVAIWSGEDSYETIILPRLMASGANMENVYFLMNARQSDGTTVVFDPAEHMGALAKELAALDDLSMLIIDPIVSATKGDSHKNAEVRKSLQPLVDLLEASGAVGVGITHFTKGTQGRVIGERVTGSLAFKAIARMVIATVPVKETPGRHRQIVGKTNIAPKGGGFE